VERGLGGTAYQLSPSAEANRSGMRSIYVANYIPKGSLISPENIRCVRPGLGLHPKYYESVIGKKTTSNLFPGQPLKLEDINF
jgi:sialic acid synthase SpsE